MRKIVKNYLLNSKTQIIQTDIHLLHKAETGSQTIIETKDFSTQCDLDCEEVITKNHRDHPITLFLAEEVLRLKEFDLFMKACIRKEKDDQKNILDFTVHNNVIGTELSGLVFDSNGNVLVFSERKLNMQKSLASNQENTNKINLSSN